MATGTVKWFNPTKGFGFIQPDDGGADVFVHVSAVERSGLGSINEGQKLGYELEPDQRSGERPKKPRLPPGAFLGGDRFQTMHSGSGPSAAPRRRRHAHAP